MVLTSPDVLREVLVEKAYAFTKPPLARKSLRRVFGDGILLAEGDDHKVRLLSLIRFSC